MGIFTTVELYLELEYFFTFRFVKMFLLLKVFFARLQGVPACLITVVYVLSGLFTDSLS